MTRRLFRIGRQRWEQKDGKFQPVLLEEHIVRLITEGLWRSGVKVWRIRERIPGMCSRRNLSTPGIPDLVGYIPGSKFKANDHGGIDYSLFPLTPLYIEVKKPGGARRPAQERFIEEVQIDGCIAFFAESWDDCVREFAKRGIKLPTS
jgi:hypothetical protein